MISVSIVQTNAGLPSAIAECFEDFGGISKLIKGKIYIKVNLTMAHPSAITNPNLVIALIDYLKAQQIDPKRIFVMDNSAVSMPTRLVAKTSQLAKRVEKTGAQFLYLDECEAIPVNFDGEILKTVPFPKVLYEDLIHNKNQNTYINVPKLKTHLQTDVTICIKNQHGLMYDEEKILEHRHVEEKIVEIYRKIHADFNIVDATSVINHGVFAFLKEWEVPLNLLLAGTDGVAVDAVGAKLLGFDQIKHIRLANEQKLGVGDLAQISIKNSALLTQNQLHLNADIEKVPLELSKTITLIKGKDYEGCRGGCQATVFYLQMLTTGRKTAPTVALIGRGFDTKVLDQYQGGFIINGPCAVAELKPYFERRPDRKNLNIAYINHHFAIGDFLMAAFKVAKIPKAAMQNLMQLKMVDLMGGFIGAKVHGAHKVSMMASSAKED